MTTTSHSTGRQAGWQQGCILVLAGFLPIMAIIALAPTLPTLLAHFKDVGNPQLMVPLLLTAPSMCIALLAPVAGVWTDRVGRRQLMLWAMLLYGVGGIVPFFFDSFWMVVAGRLIIGVAEAGILTVTNTLLADYYDEVARRRWLMIQGLAGSVLGSGLLAISGFLAAQGWQWPFVVYAVAFPIFFAAYFYLYEPERRLVTVASTAAAGPFPRRTMMMVCAVTVVISVIYFVQPINFSLVLKDLGVQDPRAIGLISAVPSLGVPLGSVLFRVLGARGAKVQLVTALLLYAVGLGGIGLTDDYRVAIVFAFIQQTGSGIVVPGLILWVQVKLAFEHRGRGMGLWASAFFIAQFLSPAVVNLVRGAASGLQPAFTVFGAVAMLAAVVALLRRNSPGLPATVAKA